MQIVDILKAAQQQNSSDIHIVPGNPVMLRIDGKLVPQEIRFLPMLRRTTCFLQLFRRSLKMS